MEIDRGSSVSSESVKSHFLDHQGIIKMRKATQIDIKNDSSYDLIIVVEADPLATKLTDGTKLTPDSKKIVPTIETVRAKFETKLDVRTKNSYITVLRKKDKEAGYFLIRSKKPIERSSKWTATNKMVEGITAHVAESFLNQFFGGNFADTTVTNTQSPLIASTSPQKQSQPASGSSSKKEQQVQFTDHEADTGSPRDDKDDDEKSVEEGPQGGDSDEEEDGQTKGKKGPGSSKKSGKNNEEKKSSCCCW